MRVEAILLCDKVLREPNGKAHVSGIFDRIWAQSVPAAHSELYLYFRFVVEPQDSRKEGQDELNISITDPSGTQKMLPSVAAIVGPNNKVEGAIRLQGLPLRRWGTYRMTISFNDEEVGFCSFECANLANMGDSNVTVH